MLMAAKYGANYYGMARLVMHSGRNSMALSSMRWIIAFSVTLFHPLESESVLLDEIIPTLCGELYTLYSGWSRDCTIIFSGQLKVEERISYYSAWAAPLVLLLRQ